MHVAIPLSLRFHLERERHSVNTAERFKSGDISGLSTQVEAVIAESRHDALRELVHSTLVYLTRFSGVYPSDFTLNYDVQEVIDGRFWSSPSCACTILLPMTMADYK